MLILSSLFLKASPVWSEIDEDALMTIPEGGPVYAPTVWGDDLNLEEVEKIEADEVSLIILFLK